MKSWVRQYIGIPFITGGRTHQGCDCYGLFRLIYAEQNNMLLPDLHDLYQNALDTDVTSPIIRRYLPLLTGHRKENPQEKDAVLMLVKGHPTHIAMFVGDNYILHTTEKTGSVLQRLSDPEIQGRIEGYYAIKTADTDTSFFK